MIDASSSMEQQIANTIPLITTLPERTISTPSVRNERPVTQSEIVPGHGKADTKTENAIVISAVNQVQVMRWVRLRMHAIEQMQQQDNVRLSHTDQLILNYKDSLLSGTLTKDKLAVLYHGINDTIIQHGAVLGRILNEKTGEQTLQEDHIVLGRQTKEPGSPFERAAISAESEYAKALGLNQMTELNAKKLLVELYMLRQNIEKALFGDKVDTTLLGETGTSLHPLNYREINGNIFHDKIVEHIGTVLTRRGEAVTNGVARAYEEIYRTDPGKAVEILRQANELALIDSTSELAKGFLSRTTDISLSTTIENHAAKAVKAPTTEEISAIEAKVAAKTNEFNEADRIVHEKQKELDESEDLLEAAVLTWVKADALYVAHVKTLDPVEQRRLMNIELAAIDLINAGTSNEKDKTASKKGHQDRLRGLEDKLDKYFEEIRRLQPILEDAEIAVQIQEIKTKRDRMRLKGHDGDPGTTSTKKGEIQKAEAERSSKKKTLNVEITELEKKTKEKEAAEKGEGKEKADTLREWKSLNDGPAKQNEIISEIVTGNLSAYSIDKLTDTTERAPGQIEGMERMRELIFKTLNNEKYDPDRARKMLPDETIAKAMFWVLKIDPNKSIQRHGTRTTLLDIAGELGVHQKQLNSLDPKGSSYTVDKTRIERLIGINRKILANNMLPELKARTRFERGELFRFIIDQGVRSSAEHGDPNLSLNDFDARIRAMKPEVFTKDGEIFDEERFGHTQITEEAIVWEDTLTRPLASRTGTDLDLTYQITLKGGESGEISRQMAIKTDVHLLERFPLNITTIKPPWITDEMTKLFYKDGNFRTEYQHENAWWRLWKLRNPELQIPAYAAWDEVQHADSASAINAIDAELPGSGERIPKSVGFTAFYELSREQRLTGLRGMDSQLTGINLDAAGKDTAHLPATDDYSVEFDAAGEFYINRPGDPKKRWDDFFDDVKKQYESAKIMGIPVTKQNQRQHVQDFLMPILDAVGRAAINAKRYHP